MKALLKFNLDNPEDLTSYKRVNKSLDMALFIWDLSNLKRSYKNRDMTDKEGILFDDIFNEIHDLFEKYDINIDDLVA